MNYLFETALLYDYHFCNILIPIYRPCQESALDSVFIRPELPLIFCSFCIRFYMINRTVADELLRNIGIYAASYTAASQTRRCRDVSPWHNVSSKVRALWRGHCIPLRCTRVFHCKYSRLPDSAASFPASDIALR